MSTTPQQSIITVDEETIAIVQRVGTTWRCLFASIGDESLGNRPTIFDTIEVESDAELETLLNEKSPTKQFAILPGAYTVCRTSILPDVDDEQIEEVLRLQAEAKLLGNTPPHRRAMAPLEASIGETNRVGLIVAWTDATSVQFPGCLEDAFFIPDAASIAALLHGLRPTDPIVLADTVTGTVTIALSHANGAALRSTREDASSKALLTEGILRIARETASLHNHTESFTDSMASTLRESLAQTSDTELLLVLPEVIIAGASKSVSGIPSNDAPWWKTWGIAVGGLIAATGSLQPLTTMRQQMPEVHPSLVENITQKLENKTIAMRLGTVAILLLALGPAILSGIRLGLLEILNPEIDAQYAEVVRARKQQVVYKELGKTSWPMTKILADITNNIPIGITVDSIRVDVGQPISIRGRALDMDGKSAADVIATLQTNLQETGMFESVQFSYDTAGTYGDREFDLWAEIPEPLKRPRYTTNQDFGKWTLAMREAGISPEEEVEELAVTPADRATGNSNIHFADANELPDQPETIATIGDHEDRLPDRPAPSHRDGGLASHSSDRGTSGPATRVPDPITQEQIKLMSRSETSVALKDVANAKKRVKSTEPELKERLDKEFRMLMDHLGDLPHE
jgi:Tfp pilus assembly protein PilN